MLELKEDQTGISPVAREFFLTIFIPFIYLLAILIISKTGLVFGFGSTLGALGLVITFIGFFLWVNGFVALGPQAFSVLPKAKTLQTAGIYRFFRHPIYLGVTLTLIGLSLSSGSWPGVIYTFLIVVPLNIARAHKEEKVLIDKFGQKYLDYKKQTPL